MPGVQVLEALQSDALTAEIPVVAVSADATDDQIRHVRGRGVADYVTKPFEVPRLLGLIDKFGGRGNGNGNGAAAAQDGPSPAARDSDALLDPARVAELVALDGDGATFRSLVAAALEEAAGQIAAIAVDPTAGGGVSGVSAAAHGLKSSAALVGASRLASLADAVEQEARAGSLPDSAMIADLRRTLAATRQATIDAGGER
jgi:CheY-like chemotaxis protein